MSTVKKLTRGLEKKYIVSSFLAPLTILFEVLMEVLIPMIMAKIIDVGIANKDVSYVVRVGLIMIASSFASLTFGCLAARFAAVASLGFAHNLRKNLFSKVQEFSFHNVDKFSSSSLVTRLTTDVTNSQNAFQMIIRMCIRSPFMFISAIIMSFFVNKKLALIFLAAIPFIVIPAIFLLKAAYPRFTIMMKKYDGLNKSVQENLIGIRAVKAFVRENSEIEKFSDAAGQLMRTSISAERILIFAMPLMQLISYLGIIALLWFGGNMIIGQTLQTGQLVSLITYFMQILFSLMMIAAVFVMIVYSQASIKRIVEVLDEEVDIKDSSKIEEKNSSIEDGSIRFEDVSFSYDGRKDNCVLENINMEIKSGSTVGIIGATGSGKTSLVQLIARLYDPLEGSVYVGGKNVKDLSLKQVRSQVSMVLQNNLLFSGSIKKNLLWGLENESSGQNYTQDQIDEKIKKACDIACASSFIESFPEAYQTELGQGGVNLSGGQKQRLCIARALLKSPKILILDDSTSAVDTTTDAKIRQALRETLPATTKIIIAQRILSVMDADLIYLIEKGKIVACGRHEELLSSSDSYREIWETQSHDRDCDLEINSEEVF
ncbi:MAG: ABC transporter ATP-binding protein/permease [Treponemataceae bacterium]|nr:ABC transporter ATP-binding protein/permease [Treponemataceae bacterium]